MKQNRVFDLRCKEPPDWQVSRPANVDDCRAIIKRVHDTRASFEIIDEMWSMLAEPDAPFSFADVTRVEFYIFSLFGFGPVDVLPYLFAAARDAIESYDEMGALLSAKFKCMQSGEWQNSNSTIASAVTAA